MAEFTNIDQPLPGVTLLQCPLSSDHRGDFTKLLHADALCSLGLPFSPADSFLTRSKAGVIRGMHFQTGEAAYDKLVCCPKGRVLDVVVDVRPDSPHFDKPVAVELSDRAQPHGSSDWQGLWPWLSGPGRRQLGAVLHHHHSQPCAGSWRVVFVDRF